MYKTRDQLLKELKSLVTHVEQLEQVVEEKRGTEIGEEKFRQIFENSNDAIFLIDLAKDQILDVNSRACEMLDFTREELLAVPISAIHPNEMPKLRMFAQSVFSRGQGWTDELTCRTRLGQLISAEISASILKIDGKQCLLALVRDISERKESEEALARLASFPVQNPNPVIETDFTGHVTYCNPAAEEKFPDLHDLGHRHPILSGVKPIIIACQADSHGSVTREIEVDRANYEQKICCVPQSDLIRIFTYDLTERKRAEVALKESEQRFRSLVENAADAFFVIDDKGRLVDANQHACDSLGYTREELMALSFEDIDEKFDSARFGKLWRKLAAGVPVTIEGHHHRKDNTCFPVEVRVSVFDSGGRSLALALARDLTERIRAEVLEQENAYLREEMRMELAFGEIVGQGPALRNVLKQVELVAPTDATVLILGESGTGKELIARAIHAHSQRREKAMVKVNCGAIPRELFESEFFGHVRGSFTGATKDRAGRFELADGGTLFLDEVREIPLELQSKLLRVLQEGQFERVGDEVTRSVDVRIIAATNCDLEQEVEAGNFREDLFYRLSVFPVTVPPLRERIEDIPFLAGHFIETVCTRLNRPKAQLMSDQIRQLQNYDWPGNVRELQNVIERAVIVSHGGPLRFSVSLPATIPPQNTSPTYEHSNPSLTTAEFVSDAQFKRRERDNIIAALKHANWKVFGSGGAAELLGIKPTTLISRMKKMEIEKPR